MDKNKPEKKIRALELLRQGWQKKDIADELGVSDRTLRRWLNDESAETTATAVVEGESNRLQTYREKLLQFRQETEDVGDILMSVGLSTLKLVVDGLEKLPPEEVKGIRGISQAIKSASNAAVVATELKGDAFAIEEVLERLKALQGDSIT